MSVAWRLLLSGAGEAGFNMAMDEAVALAVRRGWSPPTVRIYQWQAPAISLGCHQPASVLEQFGEDRARGIPVVQRPTGGGAVHHDRDVSYALACRSEMLGGRPGRLLYEQFHAALVATLGQTQSRAAYTLSDRPARAHPQDSVCFQRPIQHDVMRATDKVAGAAQRRWRDGLLQQGTVFEPALSRDRLALCIRTAWAAVFRCRLTVGSLTVQERLLTDELWSKYRPWTPSSWPPGSPSASNPSR